MLNGAGMRSDDSIRYHSMVWFSDDKGKTCISMAKVKL